MYGQAVSRAGMIAMKSLIQRFLRRREDCYVCGAGSHTWRELFQCLRTERELNLGLRVTVSAKDLEREDI